MDVPALAACPRWWCPRVRGAHPGTAGACKTVVGCAVGAGRGWRCPGIQGREHRAAGGIPGVRPERAGERPGAHRHAQPWHHGETVAPDRVGTYRRRACRAGPARLPGHGGAGAPVGPGAVDGAAYARPCGHALCRGHAQRGRAACRCQLQGLGALRSHTGGPAGAAAGGCRAGRTALQQRAGLAAPAGCGSGRRGRQRPAWRAAAELEGAEPAWPGCGAGTGQPDTCQGAGNRAERLLCPPCPVRGRQTQPGRSGQAGAYQ